ncbi:galactokinase [Entomophthora muscae]|uniref:Galactokinase n=1 Tax=Entomophthora muscae TaxID=34485 RepID=A0ACC2T6H8_9FUNG|nr:galactokinase [Entomophthora muscae]
MANSLVTEFTSVKDIYSAAASSEQECRYRSLVKTFFQTYGKPPQFIARAPGRVNIIGEHIDYCGFGVLPMGIEKDVIAAVYVADEALPGETILSLANTQPDVYFKREVQFLGLDQGIVEIDAARHEWYNYCSAGFKGVLETLGTKAPRKMLCVVDGTVPGGGGLSSSSALVCCISIATMHAQGGKLSAEQLALLAVASERYVGVNGGGMDQVCSMMAKKDEALFIEFSPVLSATSVPIPLADPPISFVIANSLVVSDKATTAPFCYNLRVAETRIAASLMAHHLNVYDQVGVTPTLEDVVAAYSKTLEYPEIESSIDRAIFSLEVVIKALRRGLNYHEEGYTLTQVCEALDASEAAVTKSYLTEYPIKTDVFHLYKRAYHVLTEAQRVLQFRHLCDNAGEKLSKNIAQSLGDLMNASQNSCKALYNCSCPELDELVKLCRLNGALGSRLTGAGWGGCTISLVLQPQVNDFIQALQKSYYSKSTDEEFISAVFATHPAQGAGLMKNLEHYL